MDKSSLVIAGIRGANAGLPDEYKHSTQNFNETTGHADFYPGNFSPFE